METTGVAGFRLDAVKHIDSFFMGNFIRDMKEKIRWGFLCFWWILEPDKEANLDYLEKTEERFDLVDVRLHQNLFEASQAGANYDLRGIFTDSLVELKPDKAVTFVTTTIPNEVRLLSLLLKNGSNQQLIPSFCYAKMAFHVSFTATTMGFQGNMLNKISKKFLTAS